MSSRTFRYQKDTGPAHWPSMVGLGLITLATVVNFALAGMNHQELDAMPAALKALYEMGGRLGITIVLVMLGVSVMVAGHVMYYLQRRHQRHDPWNEQLESYASLANVPVRGGSVRLETAKYLTPPGPMVFPAERAQAVAAAQEQPA
jgi:hypothetical protein